MKPLTEKQISKDIFYFSEESIYQMIETLKNNDCVDQSLVYCFVKAFYLHTTKLYLCSKKVKLDFDEIYGAYKENLKFYYKSNNPDIEDELIDYILNFFDHSFSLIEMIEISELQDSYEFRHYVIKVFELLRMILENKSKSFIPENIFENYTKIIVEQSEKIFDYFEP